MRAAWLIAPLAAIAAGPASAMFQNGNSFYLQCQDYSKTDPAHFGMCIGYAQGVADAIVDNESGLNLKLTCFPKTIINQQLVEVFLTYLQRHPEKRHFTANSLAYGAYLEAFPCPKAPERE